MTEMILTALEAGNPLAYLAALGTLRIAALAWPKHHSRLSWRKIEGRWRPCIDSDKDINIDEWVAGLYVVLTKKDQHRAFQIAEGLKTADQRSADVDLRTLQCFKFREIVLGAQNTAMSDNRSYADFLAAFGSEVVESLDKKGKKTGMIDNTAIRLSGAGQQHFLGSMLEIARETTLENLYESLFKAWNYSDPGPSLRWDPVDDRRYALRWKQPSGDPVKTVRGANRLAMEALPLLPTSPCGGRLETTGFTRREHQNVAWSWPVWNCSLSLDVVRSLLALPELQRDVPDRRMLYAMKIEEVYRSERITQGKYRNFTMAVSA
jgi:hypothetical protein